MNKCLLDNQPMPRPVAAFIGYFCAESDWLGRFKTDRPIARLFRLDKHPDIQAKKCKALITP